MYVLRLLYAGSGETPWRGLVITCIAGIGNVTLIGLINIAAERAALGRPVGLQLLTLYLLAFGVFYFADRMSLREANRLLQNGLEALRLRIVDKIRTSELRTLENIGQGEIYATVVQETNHLSQTFPLLVSAAQSLGLLGFCLLYIAMLSQAAFLVITGVTVLGVLMFWIRRRGLRHAMFSVHAQEAVMLTQLAHYTEGFQEIRLNADKNDALHRSFIDVVETLEEKVVGIGRQWVVLLLFSNAFLYFLVGVVIFILPAFFSGYTDIIYKLSAVAIFCVGPVTAVTSAAPLFDRAETGLEHVFNLEQRLDAGALGPSEASPEDLARLADFREISLASVSFGYHKEHEPSTFAVGPWNLSFRRGELVFITGANGSGKSTALKLICGLYQPDGGQILVDGIPVRRGLVQAYRELFSTVFTDFHLFERLYGVEDVDPERVNALIARFELSGKVSYADGRFSTHDLSTGQRKRLAMIVALLEDRPIYLFDEWAADQDVRFREIYYLELLPELKRQGKTIIAVTHDDRFWSVADRRITLDLGEIRTVPAALPAPQEG
ncbi:cyclic peptide export ABC transporter [Azorhizobium doebereinerae]|uniref:cyclic peptide export ABC transporter n=1 Tax=Azorhizobium doebereinerae TaxID=281091 RepID=UPI0004013469|nr:cyclic peptide export ABC transporter [Azorhizobium doebereinerae]